MRLNRAEGAAVAITAVLLALMAGWALGAGRAARTLRLSDPDTVAAALPSPSPSGDLRASPDPSPGAAASADVPLDLNAATEEELMALPGIGEKRAADIVAWREAHGPFRYVEDLVQVPGIGEGVLEGLIDYITVGGT